MDGPSGGSAKRLAQVVIAAAIVLSVFALMRLGSAASAAVTSLSGVAAAGDAHAPEPHHGNG